MPLGETGNKLKREFRQRYGGKEEGDRVFYALENKNKKFRNAVKKGIPSDNTLALILFDLLCRPTEQEKIINKAKVLAYKVDFQGLPISIEHDAGTYKSTKHGDEVLMRYPYGYIRKTKGYDNEQIDVYLGPNPDSEMVYVVRQVNPVTGVFDEEKCMLGFDCEREAEVAYLKQYQDPRFFGGIKAKKMKDFKADIFGV